MVRNVMLTRDEAEMLTDLLMLIDGSGAYDLSSEIRVIFGMVSQERELEVRGTTIADVRREWAKKVT